MTNWLNIAVIACILLFLATAAQAHQQGSSYSQWQLAGRDAQSVTVKISALDLTRAGLHAASHADEDVARYLQSRLLLSGCMSQQATVSRNYVGWYSVSWLWRCDDDSQRMITSNVLADVAPNHLHFARWQSADGKLVDRLLNRGRRQTALTIDPQSEKIGIGAYFRLGVEHIVTGYDHLAFLLGLLLLASRKRLIWLVTGFTIGHSLTLSLASGGWLQPNIAFIEAAIAWSIALLAAEILWRSNHGRWAWLLPMLLLVLAVGRLPWLLIVGLGLFTTAYAAALDAVRGKSRDRLTAAVTVAFGLIHGCGFASILADLNSGSISLGALFGFNLGIEAGQLLLVLTALPVVWLARHWQSTVRQCLAYFLLSVASYWWMLRI